MTKTIFVLALTFLFASAAPAQTRSGGVIAGQVFAESKAQSLAGARVRLLRFGVVLEETRTSDSGVFEFRAIGEGRYTVEAEAPGFAPVTVEAGPKQASEAVFLFIDLRRRQADRTDGAKTVSVADLLIPKAALREFDRARERQRRFDCAAALKHFKNALKAYSSYAAAHNEMGNCYVQLGDNDRAEESFKQAIALDNTVYPSMNLADLYAQARRFDDARGVLEQAIRSNPGEGDAHYALALVYFKEGRIREAESAAIEANRRRHSVADVHLLLAKIYLEQGNAAAVVRQLESYLEEAPAGKYSEAIRKDLKAYALLP
jgi:tetratricopeptide (TPR) repeat protein